MVYSVRQVQVTNVGEIIVKGKRRETVVTPGLYRVGALVFFRPGKLYRVEEDITPPEVREMAEQQRGGSCHGTKKEDQS